MDEHAPPPPTVVVLGLPFHNVTFQETVAWARRRIQARQPGYIATVNMDFVMQAWRDPELQRILIEADLVVADGIPLVWLSGLLGPRLKERVTGSDLVPMLAEMTRDNGFSLFNLGGAEGVAEASAAVLVRRYPGLRVAGYHSPAYADILNMDHGDILARLAAAAPDVLLVAFGAPKQEKFINLHVRHWSVPVAIGIGGSLDFLAGTQRRAPRIAQRLALEWLWRMLSDPPRLFRRYVGNLVFFALALPRLLAIRLGQDRPAPPVPADSPLRNVALVARYPGPPGTRPAEDLCAALPAQAKGRPVVLDLSGVPWLSSLELGDLLRLATQLRQRRQAFFVTGLGSRLRTFLAWCRLTDYLEAGLSAEAIQTQLALDEVRTRHGEVVRMPDGRIQIRLPAELTAATLDAFRAIVDPSPELADAGGETWNVEAAATRFVDSAALGYFVRLAKRAKAQGATLRFVDVQPSVRQVFRIAKVDTVLLVANAPPPAPPGSH